MKPDEVIRSAVLRGARYAAQLFHAEAVANVSNRVLRRRTGTLANCIFVEVNPNMNGVAIIVGVHDPADVYAEVFEFTGRPAWFVRPVNAKALRFKVGRNEFAFSKGHEIPELKPRPFIMPAIDTKMPDAVAYMERNVASATEAVFTRVIRGK